MEFFKKYQHVKGLTGLRRKMDIQMDMLKEGDRATNIWAWSIPGLGKSESIQAYAEKNGYAFRYIPCSSMSEGEIGGMPILEKDKDGVSYLTKKMIKEYLPMPDEEDYNREGILFLDELGNLKKEIRTEFLTLTDGTKRISGYSMPPKWLVVVASNTEETGGLEAGEFAVNSKQRFINYYIEPDAKEWLVWASSKKRQNGKVGLNSLVLGYIAEHENDLADEQLATMEREDTSAMPRRWESVANEIDRFERKGILDIDEERAELEQDIIAQLGSEIGGKFIKYLDLRDKIIPSEYIYSVMPKKTYKEKSLSSMQKKYKDMLDSNSMTNSIRLISYNDAISKLSTEILNSGKKNDDVENLKKQGVLNIIEGLMYAFGDMTDYIKTFLRQIKDNEVLGDVVIKLRNELSSEAIAVVEEIYKNDNL